MRFPNNCPPLSSLARATPLPLSFATLRHRRPHRHRFRAPLPDCVHILDRSMSSAVLERGVPAYGRPHCYEFCLRSGGH